MTAPPFTSTKPLKFVRVPPCPMKSSTRRYLTGATSPSKIAGNASLWYSACSCVSYAIDLDDTGKDWQIEQLRERPREHSRYHIHSFSFECVHGKKEWMQRTYQVPNPWEIGDGHCILNQPLRRSRVPLFCLLVERMRFHKPLIGMDYHMRKRIPRCTTEVAFFFS